MYTHIKSSQRFVKYVVSINNVKIWLDFVVTLVIDIINSSVA